MHDHPGVALVCPHRLPEVAPAGRSNRPDPTLREEFDAVFDDG
jgi:hypothetical protein